MLEYAPARYIIFHNIQVLCVLCLLFVCVHALKQGDAYVHILLLSVP